MFRLLPKNKKDKLYKEYLLRRWTIFFGFLLVTSVVGAFLLLPSYSRLWLDLRDKEVQLNRKEEQIAGLSDPESIEQLESLAQKVEVLGKQRHPTYLEVIELLSQKAVEKNLTITDIDLGLRVEEDGPEKIVGTIKGNARDRQSLRDFEDRLKENELFREVRGPTLGLGERDDIDAEITFQVVTER